MLHSFWYNLGEKTFSDILAQDPGCTVTAWGYCGDPDVEPARGRGRFGRRREEGPGGDRQRAPHAAQDRARARLRGSGRRVLRGLGQSPGEGAAARPIEGLRGARGEIPGRRRGADLLRALHRGHPIAGGPDLRRVHEGGRDPGAAVREAPGPPRRRALPDPQLRRAAPRAERARRRAPLCQHRPGCAPRAAHALAHLHARRLLGRIDRHQPACRNGGKGGRRLARGLPLERL